MQQSWSTVFINYLEGSVWSTECVLTPHIHIHAHAHTKHTYVHTHMYIHMHTMQEAGRWRRKVSWNEHRMLDHLLNAGHKKYALPSHQVYSTVTERQYSSDGLCTFVPTQWTCHTHRTHAVHTQNTNNTTQASIYTNLPQTTYVWSSVIAHSSPTVVI